MCEPFPGFLSSGHKVNANVDPRREEAGEDHRAEEAAVRDALRPASGWRFITSGVDGVGGQAECGQTIGDQIDPEQVNGKQRCRQTDDHAEGHEEEFTGVACQQVLECLADVVVDAAALFDGGDDRGEVVIA